MKIKSIQDPQGEFVEVGEKEQLAAEAVTALEFIRACRVADVVHAQEMYQAGRQAAMRAVRPGSPISAHEREMINYAEATDQWVRTAPLARNARCTTPLEWFAHQQHRQPLSFGTPSFRLHYEPWESNTKPGRVRLVKPSENPGGGELIYEWEFSIVGYPAGGGRRAGGLLNYDQASLALEWKPTTMTPSRGAPPVELPGKSGPDPEDLSLCLKELMERPGLLYSGGPNGQPQGVTRVQQEIQKRLNGLLTRPASPVRGKIREEILERHLGAMRARVFDLQRENDGLLRMNRLLSDVAGRYVAQQAARVGGALRTFLFWSMVAGAGLGGKMAGDYLFESVGLKEDVDQRIAEGKMYALPPGISDMGAVFWSARHLEDHNRFYYDNVLDTTAFSRAFLGGKLKLMEVKTFQEGGEMKRVYHLTIPSKETGETLPGLNGSHEQNMDAMNTVTWADALNLGTNARNMTDAAVAKFIANWYKETYRDEKGWPVNLDQNHLVIQRAKDRSVTAVLYSGANAGSLLRFARVDFNGDIAQTSRQSNRRLVVVPKPLTANGRLLLWTGANQDLTVPEEYLPHAWAVRWDLGHFGDLNFTSAELAASLRRYYDRRNAVGVGDRYNEIDFVDATDPVVQRLVAQVLQGKRSDWEKLEQLRKFSQQIEYKPEAGIDVNRPPVATLLQGWGDCNNRSVFMASLFKAAGFRTALIWLDNDPKALQEIGKKRPADYFAGHVMLGIHADHFKGVPRRFDTWFYAGLKGKEEWVLAETGSGMPFGVQPISGMVITRIEEVR